MPKILQPRTLYMSHYPLLSGHPGATRMYQSMRRLFYWPAMAADAYATVRRCTTCSRDRIKLRQHNSFMKLFPAAGPLEFVALDILGPLPKTKGGNRYLLVISDRFSKLTRAIPLRTVNATNVARAFSEGWIFIYGIPTT
jgi:Integrase zinc binding domain